jgi:CRP-like cAMP-binding protein
MTVTLEQVARQALELPGVERGLLAEMMVESLEKDALPAIERAWLQEAQRRLAEARSGTAKVVSAQEAREHIERVLRQ